MNPEDLTIEAIEEYYELPAEKWHGRCSELAHAAIDILERGNYAYGHYLGRVDPEGYWDARGVLRHGWVLLDDGRIVDPTRWSFENVEPYIYIGENDGDYDEGGNKLRTALTQPCPSAKDGELANLEEVMCSATLFEHLTSTPFAEMTRDQAVWVANLSYGDLDFAVASIYSTLIAGGMEVFIPIDNYNMAVREGRIKPKANAG